MTSVVTATKSHKPYLIQAMAHLLEHVRDTSQDAYLLRLTDDYISESAKWLEDRYQSELSSILIAEENGNPIGYVIGTVTKPFLQRCAIQEIGLIEHCWVEKECRMKGVANKLVKAIEAWFKQRSIHYIDVQYLLGNLEAEGTWENLGYKPYRVIARKLI